MDIATEIRRTERRVKRKGLSINELCRAAQVHRATWQRWKAGDTSPTIRAWARVIAAAKELTA